MGRRRIGPAAGPPEPTAAPPEPPRPRRTPWVWILMIVLAVGLIWGVWSWWKAEPAIEEMPEVAQQQVGTIQVEVSAPDGKFTPGKNRFWLSFQSADGQPAEVENVQVQFYMPPMATMPAMQSGAEVSQVSTGEFAGYVDISMSGEWQMRIAFDTPEGTQRTQLNVNAQ